MTCLVTMYRLHLNSSDYRDSCYVKWFGGKLCVVTSRCAIHIHSELFMGVHRLLRNYRKACPESSHIAAVSSLRNLNISVTSDKARHRTRQYSNQTRKCLIAKPIPTHKSKCLRHKCIHCNHYFLRLVWLPVLSSTDLRDERRLLTASAALPLSLVEGWLRAPRSL